jgi:hypothetical protein
MGLGNAPDTFYFHLFTRLRAVRMSHELKQAAVAVADILRNKDACKRAHAPAVPHTVPTVARYLPSGYWLRTGHLLGNLNQATIYTKQHVRTGRGDNQCQPGNKTHERTGQLGELYNWDLLNILTFLYLPWIHVHKTVAPQELKTIRHKTQPGQPGAEAQPGQRECQQGLVVNQLTMPPPTSLLEMKPPSFEQHNQELRQHWRRCLLIIF